MKYIISDCLNWSNIYIVTMIITMNKWLLLKKNVFFLIKYLPKIGKDVDFHNLVSNKLSIFSLKMNHNIYCLQ